jgi:hypothetical protein
VKRSGLPQRKTPLKRSAASLSRSTGLSRGKPLRKVPKPSDRPESPPGMTAAQWRYAVWKLDDGYCVGCGAGPFGPTEDSWAWHAHHCLPKGVLRARGFKDRVWDPRNGVLLCKDCHEGHHGIRPVPAERLPERARTFASELGTWASDVLVRQHPPGGGVVPPPRAGEDSR